MSNVVHDKNRIYQNTFYANYNRGLYGSIYLRRNEMQETGYSILYNLSGQLKSKNINLNNKRWDLYYREDVPVPMLIYDIQMRLRDIPEDELFDMGFYHAYKFIVFIMNRSNAGNYQKLFGTNLIPVRASNICFPCRLRDTVML